MTVNLFTFVGSTTATCQACAVKTGVYQLIGPSSTSINLCGFCIEERAEKMPTAHKALQRHLNGIPPNPKIAEVAKEKVYDQLVADTQALLTQIDQVVKGRATNSVEYALNAISKQGPLVASHLKMANSRCIKQRRHIEEIKRLMKKHGGFNI